MTTIVFDSLESALRWCRGHDVSTQYISNLQGSWMLKYPEHMRDTILHARRHPTQRKDVKGYGAPEWRSQIPFTMSHAINRTLIASRAEQQRAMDKYIEGGPTRFTRASVRYKSSTKRNLIGYLYYHGDAPYMRNIIDGDMVKAKKVKLSEPVNVRLDKFKHPVEACTSKYTARAKADKRFFIGKPRGRKA